MGGRFVGDGKARKNQSDLQDALLQDKIQCIFLTNCTKRWAMKMKEPFLLISTGPTFVMLQF